MVFACFELAARITVKVSQCEGLSVLGTGSVRKRRIAIQ